MKNQKSYYVERIKELEKRSRYLKTDFFNAKINEYKEKLSKIENDECESSNSENDE